MIVVAETSSFPETSPGDIWPQSLVTSFLSFNPLSTSQITISNI